MLSKWFLDLIVGGKCVNPDTYSTKNVQSFYKKPGYNTHIITSIFVYSKLRRCSRVRTTLTAGSVTRRGRWYAVRAAQGCTTWSASTWRRTLRWTTGSAPSASRSWTRSQWTTPRSCRWTDSSWPSTWSTRWRDWKLRGLVVFFIA